MPRISEFYGIVIVMYWREHQPPHFHANYGEFEAPFRIDPPYIMRGGFPPRAQGLITEWASLHRDELMANWERARSKQALAPIPPLP